MDFLVVNSVKDVADCIKLIQQRHCGGELPGQIIENRWVDGHELVPTINGLAGIYNLPLDQNVFNSICEGATETVFQLNTHSASRWLKHFNYQKENGNKAIDSIEGVACFTALDRPGPLDAYVVNPETGQNHNMLVEYARRLSGKEGSPDILPIFGELLPKTFGVLCYQENLQQSYQYLTGCSGSEAEEFRSNVAKKKKAKVDAAYPNFIEKAALKVGKENSEQIWKFFVSWGSYGFCKSHASAYGIIAYACAYLKYHYPLEWWCSVLNNADKNEVNDDFWHYCGSIIDLPDIKKAHKGFEIVGKRIQAPIKLLKGIGDRAHEFLVANAPYESLEDLCQKIQNHKELHATTYTAVRKDKEVLVKKMGACALKRNHIYALLVSGALDSFFPEDVPVNDRLLQYDELTTKISGKKVKSKPYPILTPLERYQVKKTVLSAFGRDLIPLISNLELENLKVRDGRLFWLFDKRIPFSGTQTFEFPFISKKRLQMLEKVTLLPDGGFHCAIAAYVEDTRHFRYHQSKEALELHLEIGGAKFKYVIWPDRETGKLDKQISKIKKGCIISCLISRTKDDKPFNVRDFVVVQDPLEDKENKNEED
jgi:hypothetical protein